MFHAGGACGTRFKGFGRTLQEELSYDIRPDSQGGWVEGKLKDQLKESEVVIMCKMPISMVIVLAICWPGNVRAGDIHFYHDGLIQEADEYSFVTVNDTDPFHTTVDMYGGFVHGIIVNDSSTFNFFQGVVDSFILQDSSTANLYGGTINLHLQAELFPTVNIYGYNFEIMEAPAGHTLSGYWGDGSEFSMYLRGATYEQVILHVIPEPASFTFVGLALLLLRTRNPHKN